MPKFCSVPIHYLFVVCQDGLYGCLVSGLRCNPELVARVLMVGEQQQPELIKPLIHTLFTSVYASCVLAQDHQHVLTLLRYVLNLVCLRVFVCVCMHLFVCVTLHCSGYACVLTFWVLCMSCTVFTLSRYCVWSSLCSGIVCGLHSAQVFCVVFTLLR